MALTGEHTRGCTHAHFKKRAGLKNPRLFSGAPKQTIRISKIFTMHSDDYQGWSRHGVLFGKIISYWEDIWSECAKKIIIIIIMSGQS